MLGQSGRFKRLKVAGLRKWTVQKSENGRVKRQRLVDLWRLNWTVQKSETGRPQRMIVNGRKEKLDGLNIKLLN